MRLVAVINDEPTAVAILAQVGLPIARSPASLAPPAAGATRPGGRGPRLRRSRATVGDRLIATIERRPTDSCVPRRQTTLEPLRPHPAKLTDRPLSDSNAPARVVDQAARAQFLFPTRQSVSEHEAEGRTALAENGNKPMTLEELDQKPFLRVRPAALGASRRMVRGTKKRSEAVSARRASRPRALTVEANSTAYRAGDRVEPARAQCISVATRA